MEFQILFLTKFVSNGLQSKRQDIQKATTVFEIIKKDIMQLVLGK